LFLVLLTEVWLAKPLFAEDVPVDARCMRVEDVPLATQCIRIDGHTFTVELPETPAQFRRGLQFRESLAPDRGMMFRFSTAEYRTFWMKDCKIALDLLFFEQGRLVDYVDTAPPCHEEVAARCPLYTSRVPADTVVELQAGTRPALALCIKQPAP
jgi:uncharacterized membrane protein (UPF0127 family)